MPKTIMIIEDDNDIRRSLRLLLESEDYDVESAENGQVALDKLAGYAKLPSLIILDLMMPVMDGFQFREEQMRIPRLSGIPVVIMTADGHVEEKTKRTGADFALRKPADIDAILNMVKRFVG